MRFWALAAIILAGGAQAQGLARPLEDIQADAGGAGPLLICAAYYRVSAASVAGAEVPAPVERSRASIEEAEFDAFVELGVAAQLMMMDEFGLGEQEVMDRHDELLTQALVSLALLLQGSPTPAEEFWRLRLLCAEERLKVQRAAGG